MRFVFLFLNILFFVCLFDYYGSLCSSLGLYLSLSPLPQGHPLSNHENGVKNEAQIAFVAHGILSALSYLHHQKLVHRLVG